MKLTALLLIIFAFQVSAKSYSQTVTYTGKNVSLEQVFDIIKQQTGYVFFYKLTDLQGAKPVTVDFKNASLHEALEALLQNQPLNYSIQGNTIFITGKPVPTASLQDLLWSVSPASPPVVVHGRVVDEKGNPLAGVNVSLEGGQTGVITDANGNYALTMTTGNGSLMFSFVGYINQEIPVNKRSEINIVMKVNVSSLDQFIVVGYGTQKKADLTGAVDQVNGERLQSRPITNVSDGLQGLIANLNVTTTTAGGTPGASKSINIRGYTGLGTAGTPLILVDGVQEPNIDEINPSDIASITVLKDAASSAIYGSRAPYGVILITTKQGKTNQPLEITYDNNFSLSQTANQYKQVNGLEWALAYNEGAENAGMPDFYTAQQIDQIKAVIANPNLPSTGPDPRPGRGLLWLGYDLSWANTDWYQAFFKPWGASQQHNIGVNGGGKNISYYFGLGYNDKGAMDKWFDDGYKRYNLRANITSHINKWITAAFRSSFAQTGSSLPSDATGTFQNLYAKLPTSPLYTPLGGLWRDALAMTDSGGISQSRTDNSYLTGDITLKPLPGWEIEGTYSYNYTSAYSSISSYYPQYIQTNGQRYPYTPSMTSFSETSALSNYQTYNIYTSYERHVSGHYFKLLVGNQQEFDQYNSLTASDGYLYSSSVQPTLSLAYGTNRAASDMFYKWATEGTFVRFNYNFKEKYLLEFNGRYDGASLFPSGNRYHFFPSLSAGYNIAREKFWKPLSNAIDNLKLRASYGSLGDITTLLTAGSYYLYQSRLTASPPASTNYLFGDGLESEVTPGSLVSPNVTWAKPSMLDFGVDAVALNQRLNISFDWYRRKTIDLYGPPEQNPAVLGISPPQENNTSIETKGFDLTTSWNDHIGKLNYNVRFTLSNYKGKVLSYPNPVGSITTYYNGMNMGDIWGFQTVGLFQSQTDITKAPGQTKLNANWYPGDVQYKDLNGDGIISQGNNTLTNPGDQKVIGNNTPEYNYGFTLSLEDRGFDFLAFIQGVGKREFWPGITPFFWGETGNEYGSDITPENYNNRWTAQTPNGYFPLYYMSSQGAKDQYSQTRYLLNGAYLRLKNLQLGYTIPDALTKRVHVERFRIYFSAENLFTYSPELHKYFQMDPELLISNGNIYPIQKTFSFGLDINIQ